MPFPHELIESNLDYLVRRKKFDFHGRSERGGKTKANFLLLGILIPETLSDELADCVESSGLCRRAMLLERYESEGF